MSKQKKNLLWAFVEDDIDNNAIFFPAGTPLTTLQSKRHYELLKTQHHRQKERLIAYQVHELQEHESNAVRQNSSLQSDTNNFACEEISGPRFLVENGETIGRLLSNNYTLDPSLPRESENLRSDKKHSETLSKIKEEYRHSVDKILQRHQIEYDDLLDYQRKEKSEFSVDTLYPRLDPPAAENRYDTPEDKKRTQKRRRSLEAGQCTEVLERKKTTKPIDDIPVKKEYEYKSKPACSSATPAVVSWTKPKPSLVNTFSNTGKAPPTVLSVPTKGKIPPNVSSSTPLTHKPLDNKSRKGIPKKDPLGLPLVSISNKGKDHTNNSKKNSSAPLFNNNPKKKNKTVSLVDKGILRVLRGPDRVVICDQSGTQTAYGDPKDYDDAINGSKTRQDNPVYKRMMNGVQHLFYKTNTGRVVTIGPVSKVQPAIHKFFLSM